MSGTLDSSLVLQEYTRARLDLEGENIEKVYFYKTDKRSNPKQEDPFRFFPGNIPLLVSAPHAVRHYRQKKIKKSDEYTGSLAFLLHKLTGCHVLAVTKLYGGDPNVDYPCLYKERATEICRREKVTLVLDLHGAAREREFDVDFGTDRLKNLLGKKQALEVLEENCYLFGIKTISRDYFPASGSNTVSNFISQAVGIPAVQIEINKFFRSPAVNPQAFYRVLGALSKSIKELHTELHKGL